MTQAFSHRLVTTGVRIVASLCLFWFSGVLCSCGTGVLCARSLNVYTEQKDEKGGGLGRRAMFFRVASSKWSSCIVLCHFLKG